MLLYQSQIGTKLTQQILSRDFFTMFYSRNFPCHLLIPVVVYDPDIPEFRSLFRRPVDHVLYSLP